MKILTLLFGISLTVAAGAQVLSPAPGSALGGAMSGATESNLQTEAEAEGKALFLPPAPLEQQRMEEPIPWPEVRPTGETVTVPFLVPEPASKVPGQTP